ncbi:MAG TPA: hypothetical protein VFG30_05070 [Polyangiales bacterium]|nr:hypothetical protein [Polyangiales bacterium]HTE46223.1 hypothetical protein [Gemmatimonadaceae bacterium]
MGDKCRLNAVWVLVGALAANAAVGCKNDVEEQRRQLLQTDQRTKERNARIEAHRVLGPEGELLPSETKVAGVVLPRGFELKFTEPHAWTYDGHYPQAKLEAYFDKRVTTKTRTNKPLGEVEYLGVREKSDPNMTAVLVRVSPAPGRLEWTRIYVGEPVPADPNARLVDDQALRELMAERRKNAR